MTREELREEFKRILDETDKLENLTRNTIAREKEGLASHEEKCMQAIRTLRMFRELVLDLAVAADE